VEWHGFSGRGAITRDEHTFGGKHEVARYQSATDQQNSHEVSFPSKHEES